MVFVQLIEFEFATDDIFKWCFKRYNGNYKTKDFTCWKQFLCMAFGQLTHRESLSDTAHCLSLHKSKLYHLGIGKAFDKSTNSRANESRDWRIFRDFGLKLIEQAQLLCADDYQPDIKLKGKIFALMPLSLICACHVKPNRPFSRGIPDSSEFKGSLAEQFVLQHLKIRQIVQVYYWSSETARAELDFVIQNNDLVVRLKSRWMKT